MKWPFYELRDKPPGEDDGGGGDPPKDPPKDPPATPPKGGEPPKKPEASGAIPLDVLPEELRDRPHAEQKFILEHMVQSLATRNREVSDLKEQIAELRGAVSAQPKTPAEPDPHEGKTITELMLEDSEAALDKYMEARGYVNAFNTLSGRVDSAELSMVRAEIDDFDEYEDDVKQLLKEGKLAPTRENVRGAYTMAVGNRVLEKKARERRAAGGTVPPSSPPPPDPEKDAPQLSQLETEIAAAHGMSAEEWIESKKDAPLALKLPT